MSQSDGANTLKRMEFEYMDQVFEFNLNPEEYTQEEPTRSAVTQTKGGAWIDDFGPGLPTITMQGKTGLKNGYAKFMELRSLMRNYMGSVIPGQSNLDELIFHNLTDEESWVVHCDPNTGFKLYRSKSYPLMFMYEIHLVCLRNADTPAVVDDYGVGNPLGSALPDADSTNQVQVYSLSAYATPYMGKALDVDSSGNITSSLANYTTGVSVLSNGQVTITPVDTELLTLGSSDIIPIYNPFVSLLTYSMYQDLKSGYSSHVNTESLSSDSLAYKIINASTIGFPGSLENSIKATLLEVYAVYNALNQDSPKLSGVISREEVLRTAQNIGYITYKLADVVGYDLTIVEGLRWLQRCIQYIARSYDLFDTDYTAQLSAYESVVDGDSDE